MNSETVWTFKTANFTVALEVMPEDMDPADSFEFAEDIAAVRNGDVAWFQASVVVYGHDGEELGRDSLGGCAYANVRDFYTSHRDADPMNRNCSIMRAARGDNVVICDYFPSMVRAAITEARAAMARRSKVYGGSHA
jgi:hypothetical protein